MSKPDVRTLKLLKDYDIHGRVERIEILESAFFPLGFRNGNLPFYMTFRAGNYEIWILTNTLQLDKRYYYHKGNSYFLAVIRGLDDNIRSLREANRACCLRSSHVMYNYLMSVPNVLGCLETKLEAERDEIIDEMEALSTNRLIMLDYKDQNMNFSFN